RFLAHKAHLISPVLPKIDGCDVAVLALGTVAGWGPVVISPLSRSLERLILQHLTLAAFWVI
ncbi:MAG TPA: hypothetical protein V6D04_10705, partial [Candidatus Obscuribacterales bacterium]